MEISQTQRKSLWDGQIDIITVTQLHNYTLIARSESKEGECLGRMRLSSDYVLIQLQPVYTEALHSFWSARTAYVRLGRTNHNPGLAKIKSQAIFIAFSRGLIA